MVSGNVLLDMLLFDSSSDDNSAVFIMLAFLHQKRLNRRKRSRIRPLRRQSRSLPRPFIPSNPELQANNDDVAEVGEYDESLSYSSGYEGEDSSADEVDVNSSGSLTKDDDIGIKDGGQGDANVVNTLSNTVAKETGNWVSSAGYVQEQFA